MRLLPLLLATALSGLVASTLDQAPAQAPAVALLRVPDGGIQPQLVMDARGVGHLIYMKGDPANSDLFYVRLTEGQQFSAPIRVNSQPGSAVAAGTMRGGQIAIGRDGWVHVAWQGSGIAEPRAAGKATPLLYSRLRANGRVFEPQRNVVQTELAGLDADTLAADGSGNVYVAWHAGAPGVTKESDRRVYVTRSSDDGRTFAVEEAASPAATGACGCCGLRAMTDRAGQLFLLYRSAATVMDRDTYLLTSSDRSRTFSATKLDEWRIGACPMSSYSLAVTPAGVLAAWEKAGEVRWQQVTGSSAPRAVAPPVPATNRKHPVLAVNGRREVLMAWAEDTGWKKGGSLAWQVFNAAGEPRGAAGAQPGVPMWGLAAVGARPDGGFVIVY